MIGLWKNFIIAPLILNKKTKYNKKQEFKRYLANRNLDLRKYKLMKFPKSFQRISLSTKTIKQITEKAEIGQ